MGTNSILKELPGGQMADQLTGFDKLATAQRDELLRKLQQQVEENDDVSEEYSSWVRGEISSSAAASPTKRCRFFDKHGFIFIPGFANANEVDSMKSTMKEMVDNDWEPNNEKTQVFRTDEGQLEEQGTSDYFLDSATKVHFFAEKDAIDENGKLKVEYHSDKIAALNKAGHGMHLTPGPFQDYTQSEKVGKLLRELGWQEPCVPQSMYIYKQAHIGGEVTSHQDSTFLHTTPRQTCIGLWLALDDATLENGCMWVRPGSHHEPLRRQFVRNPKHFGASLAYDGSQDEDRSEPQMIFRLLNENKHVKWEGSIPENSELPDCEGLYGNGFVPVPCKAGDLLAFCGHLDHLSLPNYSSNARHTFQLHCIEGKDTTWSKENWLQSDIAFMKL